MKSSKTFNLSSRLTVSALTFVSLSSNMEQVARVKRQTIKSKHLKGQLGPPVNDKNVCVCLCVTKNEHFLELPPSAPKVGWEPPCRHQKSSLTQEGQ